MELKQGDVVAVAYLGGVRPAVIVSGRKMRDEISKFYVAMVTRASNQAVPGDVVLQDSQAAGLNVESRVRPSKIATLDANGIVARLGQLTSSETEVVLARVRQFLVR